MKIKTVLAFLFLFGIFTHAEAQIWKKVKNAAQRGVERTIENRTDREVSATTDGAIDAALGKNNKKSSSKEANRPANDKQVRTGSLEDNSSLSEVGENQVSFKRGNNILYEDDFSKDAIGDFPAKWNTTMGGDVKKLKGIPGHWLKVPARSAVNLEMNKPFPPNFTVELDLILPADTEYNYAAIGFNKDNTKFDHFFAPKEGFAVMFHSRNQVPDFQFGNKELGWTGKVYDFPFNKKIHLAFEVNNHERMRVYIDGTKVVDLPRIFKPEYANNFILNALTSGAGASKLSYFYVSNVVIAETDTDQRSNVMKELMEKGSFSTSEILFATGSDKIQASSNTILDELGQIIVKSPETGLTIIGHTDSVGNTKANQKLSKERAAAVKRYLISEHGIKESRLSVVGKGDSEPIASNKTSAGKSQNRRVEFKINK